MKMKEQIEVEIYNDLTLCISKKCKWVPSWHGSVD